MQIISQNRYAVEVLDLNKETFIVCKVFLNINLKILIYLV